MVFGDCNFPAAYRLYPRPHPDRLSQPMIASTQTNHPLASFTVPRTQQALEAACARLRAAGLRITQPRVAILSVLIRKTSPVTIEQIHAELADSACDLVTVYRCLAAFQEVGLVRLSYFQNGTSLYQMALDQKEPTYHVVAKDHSWADALPNELSRELHAVVSKIESSLRDQGYDNVSHVVTFFGQKGASSAAPERSQNSAIGTL